MLGGRGPPSLSRFLWAPPGAAAIAVFLRKGTNNKLPFNISLMLLPHFKTFRCYRLAIHYQTSLRPFKTIWEEIFTERDNFQFYLF